MRGDSFPVIVHLAFTTSVEEVIFKVLVELERSHLVGDDKNVVRGNLVPLF